MQRTQIYFEPSTLNTLKEIASASSISVSEFIRRAVNKEIKKHKNDGLEQFLETMQPLESFKDIDAVTFVEDMRGKSRLLNENK